MARRTAALIARTTAAMAAAGDLDAALQGLLAGVRDLTGADSGGVRILKERNQFPGWCRLYFWRGGEDFVWLEVENLPDSNTVQVLTTGQGIYTADLLLLAKRGDRSAQEASDHDQLRSSLIVPLRTGGCVIGSLHADARRAHAFSRALLVPLQILADHAAGAIARAQIDEKEQVARRHLLLALQSSGTVTFACDLEGRLESITGDVSALLGQRSEAVVGKRVLDLAHPTVHDITAAALEEWRKGRLETLRIETLLRHTSGAAVPVLLALGARWEQGSTVGGIGAIADLSRVRRLESELAEVLTRLAEREASLAAAQKIAHLGHWEWDLVTGRRWWSEELFRIFGFSPVREVPSFEAFVQMVHPVHRREVEAAMRTALEDHQDVALEFRIVRSDGTERWIYLRGEVQAGRQGKTQRFVSTVLDITERKHAELLLEQQYREKDEFLSFISHELRTPLTAIRGYANLLLGGEVGKLSADQEDSLQIIQRNADHMVSLIDDLLNLLHLESGKMRLEFSLVPLVPLLEQIVGTFRPQFMAKQQRVLLELSHQLPPIVADASRLAQVFTNLISNAHKYTLEGGQITLRAWCEDDQVFVAVADSGVGISPEDQAQLFTKFFRAKHHLVRSEGGTGLGLAISRQLIELHGGCIAVTSEPDRGSTFTVSLPLLPKGAVSGEVGISGKTS